MGGRLGKAGGVEDLDADVDQASYKQMEDTDPLVARRTRDRKPAFPKQALAVFAGLDPPSLKEIP